MASTIIVLAILLSGALAAIVAGKKAPAEILSEPLGDELTDPHRWS